MFDEINRHRFAWTAGLGCAVLTLLMLVAIPAAFMLPLNGRRSSPPKIPNPMNIASRLFGNGKKVQEVDPAKQDIPGPGTETFSDLYHHLNPAVVAIRRYPKGGTPQPEVIASGIILDETGRILTSYHFDSPATFLTVVFSGGVEKAATQIGYDEETGLTILKVDGLAGDAHPLDFSQAGEPQPGERCFVIAGAPQSEGSIFTNLISSTGSAYDLGIQGSSFPVFIRLDQSLREEYVGAPLFNLQGQFIGLLTQTTTDISGIRDAIPAQFIQKIAPVLAQKGAYQPAWLGVESITLNLPIQNANGFTIRQGAYIDRITPGSPAAIAGLNGTSGTKSINGMEIPSGGDVILAVNGSPINSNNELQQALFLRQPGEEITLTILHNSETKDLKVRLVSQPKK